MISESQFSDLVEGRRKAIEVSDFISPSIRSHLCFQWGRARAIRDAYNEVVRQKQVPDLFLLTTADVYAWLREEGHIRRGSRVTAAQSLDKTEMHCGRETKSHWCLLCGSERALHLLVTSEQVKGDGAFIQSGNENIAMPSDCPIAAQNPIIHKLRPVNVEHLRTSCTTSLTRNPVWKPITGSLDAKTIVHLADPHLTLALRRLIRPLNLSTFDSRLSCDSPFPLDHIGQTPDDIKATLAPYSTLAVCLRPFIRRIVLSGLDVAKRQKVLFASSRKHPKRGPQDYEPDISLLAPAHILTGIRNRGRQASRNGGGIDEAILLCLSGLGTVLGSPQQETDDLEKAVRTET